MLTRTLVVVVVCWVVCSCCVGSTAVQAAESSKAPRPSGAFSAPVPIADSEIIPRADEVVKFLQKLRLQVAADSTLKSIQADLSAFAEKSDRQRESEAEITSKSRSVQRLNEVLREWSLGRSQLEDWEQALAKRSKTLAAQHRDIDQITETWRATQDAVAKKYLFKAVLQRRVDEVLQEAEVTRVAIEEQTAKLLKLQSQVADRLLALAETRKEIDQARQELGRNLLMLDSAPLWQALFGAEAQDTIMQETSGSARRMLDDLRDFLKNYSERITFHLVFFLALVLLFTFLRRGLTPEAAQRLGSPAAIFVLDRPFSSSLLLALIPSPWVYPGVAAAILRTAMVPSVISVIRLLSGLLPRMPQRWVYLFAALYVLEFFYSLLPEDRLLARVLLLFIATVGWIGLGLFLRSPKAQFLGSSSVERVILLVARLVWGLFAVAIVSNLVGNMSLAEFLVVAPVRMAYVGALIFAGAQLLMTLSVVGLQSPTARVLRSVREHSELLASRCRVIIRLAAITLWGCVTLYMLGVLGDVLAAGGAFLQLRWKVGATEISVERVAIFVTVLVSAILLSWLLRFVLTEEIFPRIVLPRGVPAAVDVLSRYSVLLMGFLIALAATGVDFSKVTLLISALGVGIGFGLQNLVNNFVSGLILVFEHPVQVGDSVEVGTVFGDVRKIGFRASVLRTPDGADVIVPNSELIGSRVINWSLFDRLRRISISVNVAHGTDPDRVIGILVGVARKHPAVLANPPPLAVFDRLADSALNFTLFCWSYVDTFFVTRSELTIAINNAIAEAAIRIPFPQQDVHVHWPDGQGAPLEASALSKDVEQIKSV